MRVFLLILLFSFLLLVESKSVRRRNVEEIGGFYQGDILLAPGQIAGRSGVISPASRWPNNTIPYTIADDYSRAEKIYIREAMDEIEKHTCIRFVPRTDEINYLTIIDEGACATYVGNLNSGPQNLFLMIGEGIGRWTCLDKGIIMHELTHTIGFYHMQSSPDRDNYVEIMWDNIYEGSWHNFDLLDEKYYSNFGIPYDYMSLMHYEQFAFSNDYWNKPSIVTKDPYYQELIGQREGYSSLDVQRINKMYECKN